MAEQKEIPQIIGRTHEKFKTPYISLFLTAIVMLILTIQSSFISALTIATITRLLVYAATCASLPVFRYRENAPEAKFIAPFGVAAAILAGTFVGGGIGQRVISQFGEPLAQVRLTMPKERESDMPPPGFLQRRWGSGSASYQAKQRPAAPTAVSNWIPIGPTQMTDVGSNTILEPSQGRVNCVAVSPTDANRILIGAGSG
jgi:amino acid transporter